MSDTPTSFSGSWVDLTTDLNSRSGSGTVSPIMALGSDSQFMRMLREAQVCKENTIMIRSYKDFISRVRVTAPRVGSPPTFPPSTLPSLRPRAPTPGWLTATTPTPTSGRFTSTRSRRGTWPCLTSSGTGAHGTFYNVYLEWENYLSFQAQHHASQEMEVCQYKLQVQHRQLHAVPEEGPGAGEVLLHGCVHQHPLSHHRGWDRDLVLPPVVLWARKNPLCLNRHSYNRKKQWLCKAQCTSMCVTKVILSSASVWKCWTYSNLTVSLQLRTIRVCILSYLPSAASLLKEFTFL